VLDLLNAADEYCIERWPLIDIPQMLSGGL
jgi:hypothetical protein